MYRILLAFSALFIATLMSCTTPEKPLKYAMGLNIPPGWVAPEVTEPHNFSFLGMPETFDWRSKGLSPVENQGSCGSCWAFAATSVLEDIATLTTGVPADYSEQYLVDCNKEGWGCQGGWVPHDYHKSKGHKGTHSGSAYPYQGREGSCKNLPVVDKIRDWKYVQNNPEQIKQAIFNYGPVFTVLYVDSTLQGYSGGVFSQCSTGQSNHAVTLVGWGKDYWIMKNSWGPQWGESGYMRIKFGCNNIGENTSYVVHENKLNPAPEPEPKPKPRPRPRPRPRPNPEPKPDKDKDKCCCKCVECG